MRKSATTSAAGQSRATLSSGADSSSDASLAAAAAALIAAAMPAWQQQEVHLPGQRGGSMSTCVLGKGRRTGLAVSLGQPSPGSADSLVGRRQKLLGC